MKNFPSSNLADGRASLVIVALVIGVPLLSLEARTAQAQPPVDVAVYPTVQYGGSYAVAQRAPQQMVNANWNARTDADGFKWEFDQYGRIAQRGNSLAHVYEGTMYVSINGNNFSARSAKMTPDGTRIILENNVGNVPVTRRLRVDPKHSGARWVDSYTNPTANAMNVTLRYTVHIDDGPGQILTASGTPAAKGFGEKEQGLYLTSQQSGAPVLAIAPATRRAKVRPTVKANGSTTLYLNYVLAIPPGETQSLVFGLAQYAAGSVKPKDMYKPFTGRRFLKDLPKEVAKTIVNWSGGMFMGDPPPLWTMADDLGLEPAASDVLAIRDNTRLRGKIDWQQLAITTEHGPVELAVEQVAALAGPKFLGADSRVYLRDGQVLSGELSGEQVQFTLNVGSVVDLNLARLDRVMLKAEPGDGSPAEATVALLTTFGGNRLALGPSGATLSVVTDWGKRTLSLDELRWFAMQEEAAGYQFQLEDGSRFFAQVDEATLQLHARLFPELEIPTTQVRSLTRMLTEAQFMMASEAPIREAYLLVEGDQVIVGPLADPDLTIATDSGPIPLSARHVRTLRQEATDDEFEPIIYHAELWDGSAVAGPLELEAFEVRIGEATWRVPTEAVLEMVSPRPQLTDEQRAELANLIRDLGHPEWTRREEATQALRAMGDLAAPQLRNVLRNTRDPEVRGRLEQILEG